jgi:hypothetical protein
MFTDRQHLHHKTPRTTNLMAGLGIPMGVRFDQDPGDDDGADDGPPKGGSGGGTKGQVSMSQRAFDAVMRDAKEQAKRSALAEITAKYGDLEALKTKADATDTDTAKLKEDLEAANTKLQGYLDKEAKAATLTIRQEALKAAGINPDLAEVLALEGTTAEDLATEIADKKLVETVGAVKPVPKPPVGGGTNPAGIGAEPPAGLTEAIGAHYEQKP